MFYHTTVLMEMGLANELKLVNFDAKDPSESRADKHTRSYV